MRCRYRVAERGIGERPQRDRADVTDAMAGGAQLSDRVLHELGGRSERDDDRLRVVAEAVFDAHLPFHVRDLGGDVLGLTLLPERELTDLPDAQGSDAPAATAARQ